MPAPPWLSGMLAAVMLAIAAYCATRLITACRWRRPSELDTDSVHLLMGVAMAGTLAPPLAILPPGVWEMPFTGAAGWFGWQAIRAWRGHRAGPWRCPHPVPHLAESLAMVYMLAAVPAAGGARASGMAMSGIGGMGPFPFAAVILALFMAGYVVWLSDRLISISFTAPAARGAPQAVRQWPALAPRAAACYKIAMGITMVYMLIIMA